MKLKIAALFLFSALTFLIPLSAKTQSRPIALGLSSLKKTSIPTEKQDKPAKEALYAVCDSFNILNEETGKVEKVSARDFVRGAVCAEMPPDFALEAMKAQAVASHTYALRLMHEQNKNPSPDLKGADFSANPSKWQVYTTEALARERYGDKFPIYWAKICEAADSVLNEIMIYEETPIAAAYHSMSCGKTEASENVWQSPAPYLSPVESFGDTLAESFESTVSMPDNEVKSIILSYDSSLDVSGNSDDWFSDIERSDSGYIVSLNICGKNTDGGKFRSLFSLRSSCVDIERGDGVFTFTVKGYGHGVGLSQYGADYMARQGNDYREILSHYYSGAELVKTK